MPPIVLDEYGSATSTSASETSLATASDASAAPAADVMSGLNVMGDLLDTDTVAPSDNIASGAGAAVDLMSDLFGTGGVDPTPAPSAVAPSLLSEVSTSMVAYEKNGINIMFELEKQDEPYLVTITAVTTAPQSQIHNFLLQVRIALSLVLIRTYIHTHTHIHTHSGARGGGERGSCAGDIART